MVVVFNTFKVAGVVADAIKVTGPEPKVEASGMANTAPGNTLTPPVK